MYQSEIAHNDSWNTGLAKAAALLFLIALLIEDFFLESNSSSHAIPQPPILRTSYCAHPIATTKNRDVRSLA